MTRRIGPAAAVGLLILSLSVSACGATQATDNNAAVPMGETDLGADAATEASFLSEDVIHTITVEFDETEYAEIIAAYQADQSKEWIAATVTIDGTRYEDTGMRLKGNSSLFGIAGATNRPGPVSNAESGEPQSLPWLIRLDKYTDGQNHNGIVDIVVRSNNSQTALNEAVALDLLELAGLASQDSAYASLSVNGSNPVLRLVMEHPDKIWMDKTLGQDGSLYKAEATGDYSYRGNDPDAYDEVFDLEAGNDEDLSDLIDFLDFLNNADDETFYAELDARLDTGSFATYLAMQDLIENADDIDGLGNNSYLYYDEATSMFTIVPWDHNLALGVTNGANGGMAIPEGAPPGAGGDAREQAGNGPERVRANRASNILVDRFLADDEYKALYQEARAELKASLYESGTAAEILARWTALLESEAGDLVAAATVQSESSSIATFFE